MSRVVSLGITAGCNAVLQASVALPDILTYLQTCRKSFSVADAMLWRRCPKMNCMFRRRQSALETSIFIVPGRRNIWRRSVLSGILFCVAGAVFRMLYILHFTFLGTSTTCGSVSGFALSSVTQHSHHHHTSTTYTTSTIKTTKTSTTTTTTTSSTTITSATTTTTTPTYHYHCHYHNFHYHYYHLPLPLYHDQYHCHSHYHYH